ncbi:hypothetical protein PTKIN_Ptkin01aG0296200 [Pterospermum kingtungense]
MGFNIGDGSRIYFGSQELIQEIYEAFFQAGIAPYPTIYVISWKVRPNNVWNKPLEGEVKFNVDRADAGKPSQTRIGGVLRDHLGGVLMKFSKSIDISESNYAEIMAIYEALKLFVVFSRRGVGFLCWRVTLKMLSNGFVIRVRRHRESGL